MCKHPTESIQEGNKRMREYRKELQRKKELNDKSEADKPICRRCKKEVGYLQNGLCNGCINKVSFMDYWQMKTPEEAVRLSKVQDLNKEIYNGNEKLRKKLKIEVDERVDECPKDLEKNLKKEGAWEGLLEKVQKIYPEEEEEIITIKNINKKILELMQKARELNICENCEYSKSQARFSCSNCIFYCVDNSPFLEPLTIVFKTGDGKAK